VSTFHKISLQSVIHICVAPSLSFVPWSEFGLTEVSVTQFLEIPMAGTVFFPFGGRGS